ncbi:AMP-binding protein [Nannocystis sp. SCPEA4]|uniref:AMP-binding protein n=1 Tax=Nannocystis sp. SCPEA4 TaxID=2996787 RepID=UPI00226E7442|nr:AMP-binding protein [Nannocystis sp. SCPEA4]
MSKRAELRRLLAGPRPLAIAGVSDGLSARIAERAGFAGLWASGFAISASKCLPDVGLISLHEHLAATAAIVAATGVPVIADIDDGFGDAINVVRAVREYEAAGTAAVCLEDNQHPKRNSLYAGLDRKLVDCEVFARKIEAARDSRRDPQFVVVARTEALVAGLGQAEAYRRARAYAEAGADVVLVHAKASTPAPILEFGRRWDLPVPLAAVPSTYPGVSEEELYAAGYRLIVFANQGLRAAVAAMERTFRALATTRSAAAVEDAVSPLSDVFALVDYEEIGRLNARYIDHSPRDSENLFYQLLIANPDARPERPAIRTASLQLSYGELTDAVRGIARQLLAAGVGAGERVALRLRNSIEYVAMFLGITAIGAIVVPIDPGAGDERSQLIVKDTAPRFCLVHAGDAGPAEVACHAVVLDGASKHAVFVPPLPRVAAEAPLPAVADNVDACILYSAGSTGRPKGVVLGHRHFLAIARSLSQVVGMGPEHRDLILSPMTHSGGWQRVTSTLLRGGTVVVFEGMFSVAALVEDLARFAITGFFTTPPLLRTILRADPGKFAGLPDALRSIEIASAPVTAAELAQLAELFPNIDIYLQYGLTECSRALILDARKYPHKLHTVGLPTRGVEVVVCGEDGRALPPGQEGEILLRAPQRTDHYWNLPDLDASRFRDGWLLTGDFGVRDDDGFVSYRGRRDDRINCGGMSYFPAEVELLLGALPGVKDALVAGVPDPQRLLTDVPWIFVVPHNPEAWSVREFMGHARARLPAHMIPRNVVLVPAIPLTPSGKPDRRETVRRHGPGQAGAT